MTQFFENLLDASVSGSIVIAAVLILRLALGKTPKKFLCLLWLLAVVRLLMPFEIQSNLSLQPELPGASRVQQAYVPSRAPEAAPLPAAPAPQMAEAPVFSQPAPAVEAQLETAAPAAPERVQEPLDLTVLIPWIWLTVACCFGIYTVFAYVTLKTKVRDAVKIPGGWESEHIDTAFILGFLRPRIYIPMGLPLSMRKHILAHERTHLEKGDHWLKMAGFIALSLHWFNPLVWLAYVLMCKDIEMACDERVVQFMELEDRKRYSAALLTCSARRSHFSACPVAFGEVSVKERIRRVLNYRKPGFWISLLGVAAVAFVAVCLVTSPVEEAAGDAPAAQANEEAAVEASAAQANAEALFQEDMTEEEILAAIHTGIYDLVNRESYFVLRESAQKDTGEDAFTYEYRRHGSDVMVLSQSMGSYGGSYLSFGDMTANHLGDAWVKEEVTVLPDIWLLELDRAGVTEMPGNWFLGSGITVQQAGVVSGNTLQTAGEWEYYGKERIPVTVRFTFHSDGTLATMEREREMDYGTYVDRYTVQTEDLQTTYDKIKAEAETAMTAEELDAFRIKAQQVTEVPSNKTDYDKNFMLGSGQMGWQMADGEWFFKFGAEDVSPTGATLVIEYSGPYGGNTIASGTVEAGDTYFIERLENDVWVEVPVKQDAFQTIPRKALTTGNRQSISWEANYGQLGGGFYRIGNHYTFTSGDITDTQVCYAKFRIYDPNHQVLLSQARAAVEELKNRDSYHLYTFDWGLSMGGEVQLQDEVWKNGADYLLSSKRMKAGEPDSLSGAMWKDGAYYGLEWEDEAVTSPVSSWWRSVDGYQDNTNFTMWTWNFEWYDANVELIYKDGNSIHIQENYDFSDQYECTEIVLTLDDAGKLLGMTKQYLTSRTGAEQDKQVSHELAVFDASQQESGKVIAAQDVTAPMPFSYQEDIKATPGAQVTGFQNTTVSPITTWGQAVARADRECTLEPLMNFDSGYLQTKVYRDEEEKVWKVELYWWQHDTAQTVWMNDDGLTLRMVTVE